MAKESDRDTATPIATDRDTNRDNRDTRDPEAIIAERTAGAVMAEPEWADRLIRPIAGPYRGQAIYAGDDFDAAIAEGWAVAAGDPDPEELGDAGELAAAASAMSRKWAEAGGPSTEGVPPGGGGGSGEAPILTSISPDTAEVGGADLTLTATGSGFTASSVIVFNGGDEPTTFVSPTELTTGVKPSTASGAVAVPITIRNGAQVSAPQTFTFTDPEGATRRARR